MRLWFVSATRLAEPAFRSESLLGRSLARIESSTPCVVAGAYQNARPLADVYNRAIDLAAPDDRLVFVHDDVWLDDWNVGLRIADALAAYDVVGVAGNRQRAPRQAQWLFDRDRPRAPQPLSGAVAHGEPERSSPTVYGPSPAAVKLLDGVLIAARADRLKERGVRFDPRFAFHFYDLDFCRACERAGLTMGTWPIAITHRSAGGGYGSASWTEAYEAYLAKWGD
jgi:GT2 family glycosyltransferase